MRIVDTLSRLFGRGSGSRADAPQAEPQADEASPRGVSRTATHHVVLVDLGREGESDWYYSEKGEFRVIRESDGATVLAFKVTRTYDNMEWDAREFVSGPKEVTLSEDGRTVICIYAGSHATGVSFPGRESPDIRERYSLETLERLDP